MKTAPIRLSFQCDQNWDDMSPTANGKFCQSCSREVIDFTSKSRAEIRNHIRNSEGRVCGQVLPSHVDPNIIAELRMPSWVRRTIAVASMGLIASTTPALAQNTHYVKPTITMPESGDTLIVDHASSEHSGEIVEKVTCTDTSSTSYPKPKELFSIRRRTVFLVKGFPFVLVRRKFRSRIVCDLFDFQDCE